MIERFIEFTSNISLAYKHIMKIKGEHMAVFGLKASHVMGLFNIGQSDQGLTAGDLIRLCREDKAGISKCLATLKNQGLIAADDDNGNKKYRAVYTLTEKGTEVYRQVSDIILQVVQQSGQGLSESERTTFYRALGIIVGNLEKICTKMETPNASD